MVVMDGGWNRTGLEQAGLEQGCNSRVGTEGLGHAWNVLEQGWNRLGSDCIVLGRLVAPAGSNLSNSQRLSGPSQTSAQNAQPWHNKKKLRPSRLGLGLLYQPTLLNLKAALGIYFFTCALFGLISAFCTKLLWEYFLGSLN